MNQQHSRTLYFAVEEQIREFAADCFDRKRIEQIRSAGMFFGSLVDTGKQSRMAAQNQILNYCHDLADRRGN